MKVFGRLTDFKIEVAASDGRELTQVPTAGVGG